MNPDKCFIDQKLEEGMSIDQTYQAYAERARAIICNHGWMVQGVSEGDDFPEFAYTIGLSDKYKCELIVVGLDPARATLVLNSAAKTLLARGNVPLKPGEKIEKVVEGYSVCFIAVDEEPRKELMHMNELVTGKSDFQALQLVWPDRSGCFPWDSECTPVVKVFQPLLGPAPTTLE